MGGLAWCPAPKQTLGEAASHTRPPTLTGCVGGRAAQQNLAPASCHISGALIWK